LLAQSLRAAGFGVEILDCDAPHLTDDESVEEIDMANPRLVVFVVYGSEPNQGTSRMASAVPLAQKLKEIHPQYKICFCGSHTQALPMEVLCLPYVDFVLLNEGVYALRNLLAIKDLGKNGDHWSVKGIGAMVPGGISAAFDYPQLTEPEQVV